MRKQILLLSALFVSMTMLGQKSELKAAEKALKSNDFATALNVLNSVDGLIGNADQKSKAKYYYLKGKALYQNGEGGVDIEDVGKAFNDLLEFEKASNTAKYTAEISELIQNLVASTASTASNDYNTAVQTKQPSDYVRAAKGYHKVYLLSPVDTAFLDNAALLYYFGKDYDASVDAYTKLLELGYTGVTTVFTATNKESGEDVSYNDKKSMDLQVKLGIVENPRSEVKDSRRSIVFKNLALNYVEKEDLEKALSTIAEGRKEFPNSYSLLIDEANIYFRSGDEDKFKERLELAIELNPTEPSLYYNVGVMSMNQGKTDEAVGHFKKAIELKPDYADAYNNIGAAIIAKAEPIVEEMNKSLSDFKKYDELQAQQMEIYKEALPYYEKAYEFNSESINIVQTLMGLYENLSMTDKYDELKAVYDELR